MIGIALGIVAASLKLLIGYDRSYLGKGLVRLARFLLVQQWWLVAVVLGSLTPLARAIRLAGISSHPAYSSIAAGFSC